MNPKTPVYVQPTPEPTPPDPGLAALAAQNQQQQTAAMQDRVSAQSADLMTRYGSRLAMSGSIHAPLIMPNTPLSLPPLPNTLNPRSGVLNTVNPRNNVLNTGSLLNPRNGGSTLIPQAK